jgi:hypothetical protein
MVLSCGFHTIRNEFSTAFRITTFAHTLSNSWALYTITITNYGLAPELIGFPRATTVGAGIGSFTHAATQVEWS